MGARGRDILLLLLWSALTAIFIAVVGGHRLCGQIGLVFATYLALRWFKFTFYDVRIARSKSIKQGLEVIDLIPLNVRWAKLLAGKQFQKQQVFSAYEIHLRDKLPPPRHLIIGLEKDLAYLDKHMQGLFLWETSIAVPHRIRARIRQYEETGRAYWVTGGWPVPHLPSIKRVGKKPLRHGAILIGGEQGN